MYGVYFSLVTMLQENTPARRYRYKTVKQENDISSDMRYKSTNYLTKLYSYRADRKWLFCLKLFRKCFDCLSFILVIGF